MTHRPPTWSIVHTERVLPVCYERNQLVRIGQPSLGNPCTRILVLETKTRCLNLWFLLIQLWFLCWNEVRPSPELDVWPQWCCQSLQPGSKMWWWDRDVKTSAVDGRAKCSVREVTIHTNTHLHTTWGPVSWRTVQHPDCWTSSSFRGAWFGGSLLLWNPVTVFSKFFLDVQMASEPPTTLIL